MQSYKLDNKKMDEDFLSGKSVWCHAVVPDHTTLKEGEKLVVLLSNGKKYLGRIGKFNYKLEKGFASGKLEIHRTPK